MDVFNLEELCNKYDSLLVDTCAFFSYLERNYNFITPTIKDKTAKYNSFNEIISFWIEKIPQNPIYSTEEIKRELSLGGGMYHYTKSVKKNSGHQTRELLELRRSKQKEKKNILKLINLLQEENRILTFDSTQKELYNSFFDKYSSLLNNPSKGDSSLLFSAGALSKENDVCIISNDIHSIANWKFFLNKESIPRDKLNFYIHRGKDCYKEAIFNQTCLQ